MASAPHRSNTDFFSDLDSKAYISDLRISSPWKPYDPSSSPTWPPSTKTLINRDYADFVNLSTKLVPRPLYSSKSSTLKRKMADEIRSFNDHFVDMIVAGKGEITRGACISLAGNTYAKSPGYPRTPKAEVTEIVKEFDVPPGTYQTLSIGGTNYNISHFDDRLISGTTPGNERGILVFRTNQVFLVGLYKESLAQATTVVQEAGNQFVRWGR